MLVCWESFILCEWHSRMQINGVQCSFHHLGIPTAEVKPGERYSPQFDMYTTDSECESMRIQWHRFGPASSLNPIIKSQPHVAFKVDHLERAVAGMRLLLGPFEPIENYRVAIIEDHGQPIELVEPRLPTTRSGRASQRKAFCSRRRVRSRPKAARKVLLPRYTDHSYLPRHDLCRIAPGSRIMPTIERAARAQASVGDVGLSKVVFADGSHNVSRNLLCHPIERRRVIATRPQPAAPNRAAVRIEGFGNHFIAPITTAGGSVGCGDDAARPCS